MVTVAAAKVVAMGTGIDQKVPWDGQTEAAARAEDFTV